MIIYLRINTKIINGLTGLRNSQACSQLTGLWHLAMAKLLNGRRILWLSICSALAFLNEGGRVRQRRSNEIIQVHPNWFSFVHQSDPDRYHYSLLELRELTRYPGIQSPGQGAQNIRRSCVTSPKNPLLNLVGISFKITTPRQGKIQHI